MLARAPFVRLVVAAAALGLAFAAGMQPARAQERQERPVLFALLMSGFAPQQLSKGKCGYGRHAAESEGPFSLTVWGTGKDASYGYAGGMGSRPINDAPLPTVQ